MIDSRFPPQPRHVQVPLYPMQGDFSNCLQQHLSSGTLNDLLQWMAHRYHVESNHVSLAGKASCSLFLLLKSLQPHYFTPINVAMPAFLCPEVCHAVVAAQAEPVFIDLDENLLITPESIRFIAQAGCKILIWPQLFGGRRLNKETEELIKANNLILINDEAQSFPHRNQKKVDGDVALFSFGQSKKLAAKGGGGLCFQNRELQKIFQSGLSQAGSLFSPTRRHYFQSLLKQKCIHYDWELANRFRWAPLLENDLKVLLEKRAFLNAPFASSPMDQTQIYFINQRIKAYCFEEHAQRTTLLKKVVRNRFGYSACHLLNDIEDPSIFAIRVPADRRYAISEALAKRGIQTTWYYYPLNQLTFLNQKLSEMTPVTQKISSEILILPFQWRHSANHFSLLINAIESLDSCELQK